MKSKVPLSVCHTLVDYVLSPHATTNIPTSVVEPAGKDERYSALDICTLLYELHGRCNGLLEKYANVGDGSSSSGGGSGGSGGVGGGSGGGGGSYDAWTDVWKPILISMARCTQSTHQGVIKDALDKLSNALCSDDHGLWLTSRQWCQVYEELIFPLVTSICRRCAAARAQAALTSPTRAAASSTVNSPPPADDDDVWSAELRRRALQMLTFVLVKRAELMMKKEDDFRTIWVKAIRTSSNIEEEEDITKRLEFVKGMVDGLRGQNLYGEELEAITKATLTPNVYASLLTVTTTKVAPVEIAVEITAKIAAKIAATETDNSSVGREVKESGPPPL